MTFLKTSACLLFVSFSLFSISTRPAEAAGMFLCLSPPDPVYTLAYGSRYADGDASRSTINAARNAEAKEALEPVDNFLRDVSEMANKIYDPDLDKGVVANCTMSHIATWARANALADLQSQTAKMTIGSRLASLGMVILQIEPYAASQADREIVKTWLAGLMERQMEFWERDAPDGASQGNLRAWSAMAGAAIAAYTNDPVVRGWAAWSTNYILCTADADGALPQEMSRGKLALHYQLHAIAPLTVSSVLLERQGVRIAGRCEDALRRVVSFAVNDLQTGQMTAQKAGRVQSFFDGSAQIKAWNLAWLEAYLTLDNDRQLDALAERYRPLGYSKLGGNQTKIWNEMRRQF